ncbi:MAG: STAS domain-containing protein [Emcibacter sp.]|nr:STAS domain-containing protein [Emcibacter sp.]
MTSYAMVNSDDEISLTLKTIMDLTEAENLRLTFLDCLTKKKPLKILAGEVERITTPCLQILFSLKNWADYHNIDFSIVDMPQAFKTALDDIGLEEYLAPLEQRT